ncbi:hypothetical protein [Nostoc sp. CHAB 5836]|uniref:hypothetical protein n=1 Tax=Nostoc sp. CHAB 5836 TaxID=2780404 RepID=UPI0027954FBF|nr:hypothetical protein [Nostoc sp. CHAB 5836]
MVISIIEMFLFADENLNRGTGPSMPEPQSGSGWWKMLTLQLKQFRVLDTSLLSKDCQWYDTQNPGACGHKDGTEAIAGSILGKIQN